MKTIIFIEFLAALFFTAGIQKQAVTNFSNGSDQQIEKTCEIFSIDLELSVAENQDERNEDKLDHSLGVIFYQNFYREFDHQIFHKDRQKAQYSHILLIELDLPPPSLLLS